METRFEELKRYVRLTEDDAGLLASFHSVVSPHFEQIAGEFYDRIREHEEAHAVLADEAQIERLQRSLVAWLHRLLSGRYDEAYYAETMKIGRVHVKVGLPQRYMFTAMALIRVALTRLADDDRAREAVTRLLDLELAIMLESYHEDFVQRLRRRDHIEHEAQSENRARAQKRFQNAVELAPLLVVGIDAHGGVRLFNAEAERVTGFSREEAIGAPFVETFFPEDVVAPHGARVRDVAVGRRTQDLIKDGVVRTRSRKLRDVSWSLASVPVSQDGDIAAFAMGQDATDEHRAIERARQHEKLAAVGTLAAGLAHEIRNPLNGAQLHLAFLDRSLRRGGPPEEMIEAVRVVTDEVKRLALLVTEFLDFARPKPLVKKPMDVRDVCRRAVELVHAKADAARVRVRCDLPLGELALVADRSKLEQVLLNLLQNAIEALVEGGTVIVRARRQPKHVTIEVEDDGPGLSAVNAPIFDAFFSTKPEGTGLGLAIVHRIVTDHGGSIDVESRPGRTCFRVMLPMAEGEV
jgi:PAS domain S-box-containing protein